MSSIEELYDEILDLDGEVERKFRSTWPESWLQINLPLGSTRALLAIEGRNAYTPGRVAEALHVSRTTVTGLLDRLEAERLLTRSIDPADRRCLVLHVTEKGRALVEQIEGDRRERLRRALTRLDARGLEALREGLEALATALRSTELAAEAAGGAPSR